MVSTDIMAGLVQSSNCSRQKESIKSGTEKTCNDCMFAHVFDMNFEDVLECNQHNIYVTNESVICSKFIEEREVKTMKDFRDYDIDVDENDDYDVDVDENDDYDLPKKVTINNEFMYNRFMKGE